MDSLGLAGYLRVVVLVAYAFRYGGWRMDDG